MRRAGFMIEQLFVRVSPESSLLRLSVAARSVSATSR
jgi:hypothetical protein